MVEYFAVVLHQLNNLIECFTPKQFLCLATVLQWTVEQQLFAVLLKPSQLQTFIIVHCTVFTDNDTQTSTVKSI